MNGQSSRSAFSSVIRGARAFGLGIGIVYLGYYILTIKKFWNNPLEVLMIAMPFSGGLLGLGLGLRSSLRTLLLTVVAGILGSGIGYSLSIGLPMILGINNNLMTAYQNASLLLSEGLHLPISGITIGYALFGVILGAFLGSISLGWKQILLSCFAGGVGLGFGHLLYDVFQVKMIRLAVGNNTRMALLYLFSGLIEGALGGACLGVPYGFYSRRIKKTMNRKSVLKPDRSAAKALFW